MTNQLLLPRNPPPRYATPRNPARKTKGGQVGRIMTAMGIPPMPWQHDALAVACEIDPNTGGYYYDTVIVVVLRRAGKTAMSRGKLSHRALTTQDARMIYTAQNRLKALKRLKDDYYLPLTRSPFKMFLDKPRWRGGEEAVRFINGAELAIDAVKRESGHGDANDEGHIDEAYAHRDNTLEGGLAPTMMTIVGSQLWILSAAGDSASSYLLDKVELGRALVESKQESRTCYIEYSAPEDADPNDPETLLSTHPGVGHTLELDRLMSLRINSKDKDEWERAWLGWWPKAKTPPRVIPAAGWEKNYIDSDEDAWTGKPFWSIDTDPDREYASIAMAAKSMDNKATCYLELYDTLLGTAGVVPALVKLRSQFGGDLVAVDASGGAKSLTKDLEDAGFTVIKVGGPQRVDACGGFYDDALVGKLRMLNDSALNSSMGNAIKHYVGGKAFIWARNKTLADISGFYAVNFARWLFREKHGENYGADETLPD
ncbi:hypothetical protein [Arthrobacter alpinus]|uniref:hypothetical protein n=1 Tax=Arthrobacter alpinus TaxID=656366 RepID=UPI0012FF4CD1|nr:hypothetical protein [Arthrobacter alpinus]